MQFIVDREVVGVFSEMGILLLLFTIGLGLSFEKVKHIWKTSVMAVVLSTILVYVAMLLVGEVFGISRTEIILMTFCLALSSTAVTVNILKYLKEHADNIEKNTYGVLVAQDIAAIIMIIAINFIGGGQESSASYGASRILYCTLVPLSIGVAFFALRRHIHKLTSFIKKHEEMLTMSIFGICLGSAILSETAGLSAPFGGFIAGLILGNSNIKREVQNVIAPVQEILLMTFFLSIGLLVDLKFMMENAVTVSLALLFVTVGKTIINIFVFRWVRFSPKESFVMGVLLANVGEFSFMLVAAAGKGAIVNQYGVKFLISLTTLSLFFSPFWLILAERCRALTENASMPSSWDFFRLALDRDIKKLQRACSVSKHFCQQILSLCRVKNSATRHLQLSKPQDQDPIVPRQASENDPSSQTEEKL
jgi:CPA2 family monovalent cation:H+ antiporter-2